MFSILEFWEEFVSALISFYTFFTFFLLFYFPLPLSYYKRYSIILHILFFLVLDICDIFNKDVSFGGKC